MKSFKLSSLIILFVMFVAMALLAACGGGGAADSAANEPKPVGDAANGETLFHQATIGSANAPGCVTCHSVEADVVLVGPSLAGVAVRAETAVPGLTAEEYLRQSITEPNAHVVDGFTQGIMYQNYGTDLPNKTVNDLTAYLLTLN